MGNTIFTEAKSATQINEIAVTPYVKNYSPEAKEYLTKLLIDREGLENVQVLKFTQSLCPGCVDEEKFENMKINSIVYVKSNKVWQMKECQEHGITKELYWDDYEMYKKAEKFQDPGIKILNPNIDKDQFQIDCPSDCGLCVEHESHTGLGNIVITNRCDLTCWYCLSSDVEVPFKIEGNVEIKKISEVAEQFFENSKEIEVEGIKGVFAHAKDIQVLTIDDGKHVWKNVNKFLKRKYSGDFIKIKTRKGKEIKTTTDHRFILSNLERKHGFELKENDKLLSIWNLESSSMGSIDLFEAFKSLPREEAEKVYAKNSGVFGDINKIKTSLMSLGQSPELAYSWKSRDTIPLNILYNLDSHVNGVSFGVDAKTYEVNRFLKITPELSRIIGYFVSDGHYSGKKLCITAKDEWVRKDIALNLDKLGIAYSVVKSGDKAEQIFIGNKIFYLIFKHVFEIPKGARNKRLPKQFLNFDFDSKVSLLSGLFNGDGFVEAGERHGALGYGTVSKELATDLTYLLANVGIQSTVYERNMDNNELANCNLYRFYISSENFEKMRNLISFKQSHLDRLQKIGKRRASKTETFGDFIIDEIKEIETIKNSEEQDVYDLEVDSDSHCFVAGDGILISNCFFYAKEGEPIYEPTVKQIKFMLQRMRDEKPVGCNSVQFTGGEPTLREDLPEIVAAAKEIGYSHVQLNTNGISLSKPETGPELAKKLKAAGVSNLYLSFDGMTPQTNPKNYWEAQGALDSCYKAGIGVVLVPTVIGNINDHELGDIIRFGEQNMHVVRSVNFQPVSLVGRMPEKLRMRQRITIPGAIKRIEAQTDGDIGREHWFPVPCAKQITDFVEAVKQEPKYRLSIHFACGMATYVFKDTEKNKLVPISKFFDVEGFFDYLGELTKELNSSSHRTITKYWVLAKLMKNLGKYVDKEQKPKNLKFTKILTGAVGGGNYHGLADFHNNSLFIGMMHFQDPYNWDLDRIHKCDIHYATPDGKIVPFCTFNVIPEMYRDKIQRKFSVPAAQWEQQTGKSLQQDKHHRKFTPEEMKTIVANFNKCRKTLTKPQIEPDWSYAEMEHEDKVKSGMHADNHSQAKDDLIAITSLLTGGAFKFGVSQPRKHAIEASKPSGGCCGGGAAEAEESRGCGGK